MVGVNFIYPLWGAAEAASSAWPDNSSSVSGFSWEIDELKNYNFAPFIRCRAAGLLTSTTKKPLFTRREPFETRSARFSGYCDQQAAAGHQDTFYNFITCKNLPDVYFEVTYF